MRLQYFALFAVFGLSLLASLPASAWTRPGHMVTAAIAYDDLAVHDGKIIDQVVALMANHPDHGTFEVAIGRAKDEARARRIFLEMARWPDDVRGGAYDHPTWHYAFRPAVDPHAPPPVRPADDIAGAAFEAFALNVKEAADPHAPPADRAVALCWIFHLVGDIHQPLHTAQLFSSRFPAGDKGGSVEFVRDPQTGEPVTLHWFWDDSVNRLDEPEAASARAKELEMQFPRAQLAELGTGPALPSQFPHWASDESYPLAVSLAYRADVTYGDSAEHAAALPPKYIADSTAAAARRVALAGYRLADILRFVLAAH